ncbi:MAG: hypothetical protein JSV99_11390 [Planctomycetota bacterium]|nr:MAG: hypothetical protein JSV99_11390 [Planctomycetota bacterium]
MEQKAGSAHLKTVKSKIFAIKAGFFGEKWGPAGTGFGCQSGPCQRRRPTGRGQQNAETWMMQYSCPAKKLLDIL